MSKYNKKVDATQPEVVDRFRKLGASVTYLHSVGGGVADLLIGFNGNNYLVEVKSEKGRLNELQVKYKENWKGQYSVIRSAAEVDKFLGLCYN